MPEVNQSGPVFDSSCIREAVCVHTKKIMDSCRDKDCVEELRVYLTRESQNCLDRACSVKARSAELLYTVVDVEPVLFHNGFYAVDITYYYKIIVDAVIGANRPSTVYGLSRFCKRVMLYGGEGSAKVFSSKTVLGGMDEQNMAQCNMPQAVVEAVEPIILSAKMMDSCDCRRCDYDCSDLPGCISSCFDDELVVSGDSRRLYVTLGQFSIIRLERDTQLLLPCYVYCIPTKECSDVSCEQECDPCEIFSKINFPVSEFFPKGSGCGTPGAPHQNQNCSCNCGNHNCR